MELLKHPSEWNFCLPARLNPQLRGWASGFFTMRNRYARLRKIFPEKIIHDEWLFDEFLDFFSDSRSLKPDMKLPISEDEKTRKIMRNLRWFTEHDIVHLFPYACKWWANLFLWDTSLHIPRIIDSLDDFADCAEGIGAFLSPDEPPLNSYDLGEVLARCIRKISLRNKNEIHDPTLISKEMDSHFKKKKAIKMNELLSKWISDINSSLTRDIESHYMPWTTCLIQNFFEIDFHEPKWPLLIDKGNRGILFIIIYNILKNGYKMIEKFPDYSMSTEALYRDLKQEWISDSKKEELRWEIRKLEEKNHENHLFREEINRRGGKLKISAEVVDAGDAFVVHIWDNATGFDLNGIKRWIKEMVENKYADFLELCLDPILPEELRHGLKEWQRNPHMSGIISAHMPEFIKLARFSQHGSSGLGLFGSEVLARKLWWSVLAAEMINGWAFFSVVVPKDARKWIDKPDKQTKAFQQSVASRVLPVLDEKLAA
jgi:hypothetical protein